MNAHPETNFTERSKSILYPFLSGIVGSGVLWYVWLRSLNLLQRADAQWYEWIQPVMLVLVGVMGLWATLLFIMRRPLALSVFKLGLSIVPLLLLVNLLILLIRVIVNVFQGNAGVLLERILNQPYKALLIPIIVIMLMLLGALTKNEDRKTE
jgi:hypothetical protein